MAQLFLKRSSLIVHNDVDEFVFCRNVVDFPLSFFSFWKKKKIVWNAQNGNWKLQNHKNNMNNIWKTFTFRIEFRLCLKMVCFGFFLLIFSRKVKLGHSTGQRNKEKQMMEKHQLWFAPHCFCRWMCWLFVGRLFSILRLPWHLR